MRYVQAFGDVVGDFFRRLGPLRIALVGLAAACIVLAPGADVRTSYEGFGFVRTLVVPTLAPLVLVGLLQDMLMSKVVMGDAGDAGRARLRYIIRAEALVALLLVLSWLPFFLSLAA